MGFDRFANFIFKSINNDCIEEVNINNNIRPIICNTVIFDVNFLIYQEIINIENEINDVIKILLCIQSTDNDIIYELINKIFKQKHWDLYYKSFEEIFNNISDINLINNFLCFITSKIPNNTTNNLSLVEYIIYEKIIITMSDYINKFHFINKFNFVNNIAIFFDGIPSFSKVVEQRRRRTKNFLETNDKKNKFKYYFDSMVPNYTCLLNNITYHYIDNIPNNLYYDYFKWLKNRFSIDKSFGPSSEFIINLEMYLSIRLKKLYPNIKIIVNSANQNGEADIKIFKYISLLDDISGDFCIHTTDSDLIHQILIQQVYYNLINKDISLSVVKYLKNHNNIGYAQILDSQLIINNILSYYQFLTNNIKIIWDLCFIFYLFGNDHLPSSLEIGPELGFEYFINSHKSSLNNTTIIDMINNEIKINLNGLLLILKKFNLDYKKNTTRIILQRYFKINLSLINFFIDDINLDFDGIINLLKYFIVYQKSKLSKEELDDIDDDDLRKKEYICVEVNDNTLDNFNYIDINDNIKNKIINNEELIIDNINYSNNKYFGLILYIKPINIIDTGDSYQDLYSFIIDKTNLEQSTNNPLLYDHINLEYHLEMLKMKNNYNCNDYLKKLYHLAKINFGNMSDYFTDNLTYYKYNIAPPISELIIFLNNNNNYENLLNIWDNDIKDDNVSNYFNSISHHIIISPFLLEVHDSIIYYSNTLISSNIVKSSTIENIWLDLKNINNFNYKNLDIKKYLLLWNNVLEYNNNNTDY
jgi:hypothetical protein